MLYARYKRWQELKCRQWVLDLVHCINTEPDKWEVNTSYQSISFKNVRIDNFFGRFSVMIDGDYPILSRQEKSVLKRVYYKLYCQLKEEERVADVARRSNLCFQYESNNSLIN